MGRAKGGASKLMANGGRTYGKKRRKRKNGQGNKTVFA